MSAHQQSYTFLTFGDIKFNSSWKIVYINIWDDNILADCAHSPRMKEHLDNGIFLQFQLEGLFGNTLYPHLQAGNKNQRCKQDQIGKVHHKSNMKCSKEIIESTWLPRNVSFRSICSHITVGSNLISWSEHPRVIEVNKNSPNKNFNVYTSL